jgi:acid phosphatase (class A)
MRVRPLRQSGVSMLGLVLVVAITATASGSELHCPTTEALPLSVLLLPPACDNCDETRGELGELLALQQSRTPQQAEHAEKDHKKSIRRFLSEIGIEVREEQLGLADPLFQCVAKVVYSTINDAKMNFKWTRPYMVPNNGLDALQTIHPDDAYSYPSGHAAYGMAVGLLLGDMLPERAEDIYKRIEDYGFSRMVAGLHFRSDIYAGQLVGAAVVTSLYQNKEFRPVFEGAEADLRRALGY